MNGEECQILLDMGVSKLYMSKSYYLRCKLLHNLPKFASETQRIQVGNGQYVGVLFVILVIVEINKHRLKVFMLVSEIFDNVDMVLGIKNLFELEGVLCSPKFICKNNQYFDPSSIYFLYLLASLPKW